jgi:hypothetical protein
MFGGQHPSDEVTGADRVRVDTKQRSTTAKICPAEGCSRARAGVCLIEKKKDQKIEKR